MVTPTTATLTLRTFAPVIINAQTIYTQVTASSDDAHEGAAGNADITASPSITIDSTAEWLGFRFPGLPIPQGATITSAILSVVPTASNDPLVTIYAEADDNAATFAVVANGIEGRARTTANVPWDEATPFGDGATFFPAPDIAALVQEVINRAGWTSGNALAIIINGGASSLRDLATVMYDGNPSKAAKLQVTYSIPTTVTPGTGSLTLTGFAPQLRETLTPGTATLTLTGFAPSVVLGTVVTPLPAVEQTTAVYGLSGTSNRGNRENSSATYATARAGSGTHDGFTNILAGQTKVGATYTVYEGYMAFDVSGIPSGPIVAAALSLFDNVSFANHVLEMRAKTWRPTLDSADFVAGADLSALTLLASRDQAGRDAGSGFTLSEMFSLTESGTNLRDAIAAAKAGTGILEVILVSSRLVAGTTPTADEYSDLGVPSAGAFPGGEPEIQVTVIRALALITFAPSLPTTLTPATATLSLATFAPTITTTAHVVVTPDTATLTLTTFAPDVAVSAGGVFVPGTASLTLTTFAPDVTATAHVTVTPTTASLTLATFAPQLAETLTPTPVALALTGFAPTAVVNTPITPAPAALSLTTFAPVLDTGVILGTGALVLTTFAPTILTPQTVTPGTATLVLATFAPTANVAPAVALVGRARLSFSAPAAVLSYAAVAEAVLTLSAAEATLEFSSD